MIKKKKSDSNLDSIVEEAFKKLQSSLYYEKMNLHLRHKMVEFCSGDVDSKLVELKKKINDKSFSFDDELGEMKLVLLPKKLGEVDVTDENEKTDGKEIAGNLICNNHDFGNFNVKRLMIYADIPIELHIIAVMWVMRFGVDLEQGLDKYCWGNRLAIDENTGKIQTGKYLYKPYFKQFQNWWSKALDEANHLLENGDNVCILNLDIQNYYHSIRFDLEKLNDNKDLNETDERLWTLFVKIHERYNELLTKKGFRNEDDMIGFALPVGLLSSPLLANCYLKEFDKKVNDAMTPVYYGRYVDDIMFVLKCPNEPKDVSGFIKGKLSGIIEDATDESFNIIIDENSKLKLQKDKLFLYYFDHNYLAGLLSKFEKEQKTRSSEFRFLSDEEDEHFKDFETIDFESCFEDAENTKARFKPQTEDKFKLSCFLTKLIRHRIERGKSYGEAKEKQVKKYFQGSVLIKHYYFWEKLFTLYVVSEDSDAVVELYSSIKEAISQLVVEKIEDWSDIKLDVRKELVEMLSLYLNYSLCLAMSVIHLNHIDEIIEKQLGLKAQEWESYRKVHFNRGFYENRILGSLFDGSSNKYDLDCAYFPIHVKLSDIMFAYTYNAIIDNNHREYGSDFSKILDFALKKYIELNGVRKDFFQSLLINSDKGFFELEIKNACKNELTVASINLVVDKVAVQDSRRGKRLIQSNEVETYWSILDNVKKLNEVDLFVMPELSLPWDLLPQYMKFSASNQIGFVAGLEYMNANNFVYNFVITCIPFEIDHVKDCLPIIRLKKGYAPIENEYIEKELFEVPDGKNIQYPLFKWRGMHFTVFNCFELTNVVDRSRFVSLVDAVFTIAYNKDVNYYNNIAEATSRDLHCFVVLNNVAQYGNSQIVAPMSTENKFLMKVIRGASDKNRFTIETADIDIKALRLFQRYKQQINQFKPLPFGYSSDIKMVERLKDI